MEERLGSAYKSAISAQYFLYFGVLGVYLPFFNVYCYHLGFTGMQIGVISSVRSIVLVIFSILWSFVADRFQIRKRIYVICNWLSVSIWCFYFFADRYGELLLLTGVYGLFFAPIIAFLEAFAVDVLDEQKRQYGSVRAWGSIAFITMVVVLGYVIDRFSIRIILWFILVGGVFQSLLAFKLPAIASAENGNLALKAKVFFNRRVVVFLFCAFLMLVSHGMYYGFFSIHLISLGYGSLFVGFAWALASAAEVAVMVKSKVLFAHISYEKALILSFAVAAVRWFLLGWVHAPLAVSVLQLLHAATYGVFHMASILYIDMLSPRETKTLGQSVNNATTYGLGLMVGFFTSGWLYENADAAVGFFVSGGVALLAGIVFVLFGTGNRAKTDITGTG